jgi:predicted transglutaminase-like cysteine proteinase
MDKTAFITYDLAYNKTTILEKIVKEKDLIIDNLNEKIKNLSNPQEISKEKDLIIDNLNEKIKNLNETIVDLVSSKKR